MNWQHLTYFHKVAETRNLTAASRELYITTSALSKAIQNLEEELQFPLLEKSGRNVVLTKYGLEFDKYFTQANEILQSGIQTINSKVGIVSGHISMVGIWTMVGGFLPDMIRIFHQMHPGVTYSSKFQLTSQVLKSIYRGDAELGFCGDFNHKDDLAMFERHHLFSEELALILPPDHPESGRSEITVDEFSIFKDDPLITFKSISAGGIYESLMDLCKRNNIKPNIAFEARDDHAITAYVRAGLGIALIENNEWLPLDGLSVIHFKGDYIPTRNQYMIWRKNHYLSPVAKSFRDFIIEETK